MLKVKWLLKCLTRINMFENLLLLQKQRYPKLFWISAMGPMVVVVVGCVVAYLVKGTAHGIATVSNAVIYTYLYTNK